MTRGSSILNWQRNMARSVIWLNSPDVVRHSLARFALCRTPLASRRQLHVTLTPAVTDQ